jgi:hypothetical protein
VKPTVSNPEFSHVSVRILFTDKPAILLAFCVFIPFQLLTYCHFHSPANADKGVERKVTLENASVQDVKNALENLAKSN